MCPDTPKKFAKYSYEDRAFNALSKLPDDYYVFHSFSIVSTKNGKITESETDFIVFNQNLGIMCIEAKAGRPKYRNDKWYYGSGKEMAHDGPFRQATSRKHDLIDLLGELKLYNIRRNCKFVHAVWFVSVDKKYIEKKLKKLPMEASPDLILTKDSEDDIEAAIRKVFSLETSFKTNLDKRKKDILLNRILAPQFGAMSLAEYKLGHERMVFKALLDEQTALLDYLEEQNNAIINGLAGTGKTVMAVEKARRHAFKGEKVLFLCYNSKLKEYLSKTYPNKNINYYTISGYACSRCRTAKPDFRALREILKKDYLEKTFPHQHVIIDEGQDFGRDELTGREDKTRLEIVDLLKMIMLDDDSANHSFYLFYDKNQMVQSDSVPDYIRDADCKLTLYKNCRNTVNIADTSLRLLNSPVKMRMFEGAVEGSSPCLAICHDEAAFIQTLNKFIEQLWKIHIRDIQILTCKTLQKSILAGKCNGEYYLYKRVRIPFTTCRKFKGLEADAIILTDLDADDLMKNENKLGYVGASRARHELYMIASMNEENCRSVLESKEKEPGENPEETLAARYNSKLVRYE